MVTITWELPKLKLICISIPEMGHLIPILNIASELAARGHDVQLVTCSFIGEKVAAQCEKSGVRFVGVCGDLEHESSGRGEIWDLKVKQGRMISANQLICAKMEEPVTGIIEATQPDLVITAMHCFSLFDVLNNMKIPYVVNFPGAGYRLKMTFWPLIPYVLYVMTPLLGMPRKEAGGIFKTMKMMVRNQYTKMILVNSFFGFEGPQKYAPNIVFTGPTAPRLQGTVTKTSLRPLNEWLEWVRSQDLKVVYVSMGTMVELKDWQVAAFYHGLEAIPDVAVAWSLKEKLHAFLPGGNANQLPKRFFVNKWMPQTEMIQCPEVVAVITHCGWGGSMETVSAGKPMIACPFVGDQHNNAKAFHKKGLASVLHQRKLTAEMVRRETSKVLQEPSYDAAAKNMQKALLQSGGAQKCAEVIETVALHGYKELTTNEPSVGRAVVKLAVTIAVVGSILNFVRQFVSTRRRA